MLKFDANGGTGGPSDMSKIITDTSETASGSWTFTIPTTAPVKSGGWTFLGWSETADGNVQYLADAKITIEYGKTVTLYAVYVLGGSLVYDPTGGTDAPERQIFEFRGEETKELTISSETPSRDWYVFQGWATSADGNVEYHAGDKIEISRDAPDVTLYAIWTVSEELIPYAESFPALLNALIVLAVVAAILGLTIPVILRIRRGD